MAGDWIKMRVALQHDPKVRAISRTLESHSEFLWWLTCGQTNDVTVCDGALRNIVIGALHAVWCAVNEHAVDGTLEYADCTWIDTACGVPGIGNAMQKVGWVTIESNRIIFPKFNDNNTSAAERQRRYRENQAKKSNGVARNSDVTSCATSDAELRPREEKSKRRVREEKEEEEIVSCGEVSEIPSPPSVLVFPIDGKGKSIWELTEQKFEEYTQSFPSLNIMQELRAARQWCIDNPTKRKTATGMLAFLTRWLNKAQNSNTRGSPTPKKPEAQYLPLTPKLKLSDLQ